MDDKGVEYGVERRSGSWKSVKIVPVCQKGSRLGCTTFREISLIN